jgi:hypothetical protein
MRENAPPPGDPRCDGFPFSVEEALRTLTPDGWCRVGWVAGRSGRDEWDVWFHVDTGHVKHEPPQNPRR